MVNGKSEGQCCLLFAPLSIMHTTIKDDDHHNIDDDDGDMAMMMQMVKNMRILDVYCCDSVALIVVASNTNREISIDDQGRGRCP